MGNLNPGSSIALAGDPDLTARMRCFFSLMLLAVTGIQPHLSSASGTPALFEERVRTLVFVEYYTQREVDRQPGEAIGLVADDSGTIVCLPHAFPDWLPPERIRDIRLYPARNPAGEGFAADYLGQDWVNGWHYLRIRDVESAKAHLTPITHFPAGRPETGDLLWGVCMTPGDLDYIPYYRDGKLSTIQPLPLDTGFATSEVAVPGGPVFLEDGRFAGWAGRSLPMERDLWVGQDYFRANIRNPDESLMFLLAQPFLEELLKRVPPDPLYHQRPWIGISNIQPLEKETAQFMGLTGQGAIIVSEVLPDTPAAEAGLQDRDIIVGMNGQPLPRMKPDSVLQMFFEREILAAAIGEPVPFTVLRGAGEKLEIAVVPTRSPTLLKEAALQYFEEPGLTLRQFTVSDALNRREDHRQLRGVVVSYIRPNSPASAAGLEPGDWILEIGGREVDAFATAVAQMEATSAEGSPDEIVLLVRRGNETSVLRIRKSN